MKDKREQRLRRAKRTRMKIRELGANRLCVHRTPRHIYAQIIAPAGGQVLASASTVEKSWDGAGNTVDAATKIGKLVASRAKDAGIETVVFDRGGNLYHGRIAALADAAREEGLEF